MTFTEAKRSLADVGVVLRKTPHGEFRVAVRSWGDAPAYYTPDLDDAVATGYEMVQDAGGNALAMCYARAGTAK